MNIKNVKSFLSQYYDRFITVVILIVLLVFAIKLLISVDDLRKSNEQSLVLPKPAQVVPFDLDKFNEGFVLLKDSPKWEPQGLLNVLDRPPIGLQRSSIVSTNTFHHRLFIAPPMKKLGKDPFPRFWSGPGDEADKEGITYVWKDKHFPGVKTLIGNLDPDKDGFSNIEEFIAHTDPNDSKSRPDAVAKLRVDGDVRHLPFPYLFKGFVVREDGMRFQIHKGAQSYTLKEGEEIPNSGGWKLKKFEEKFIMEDTPGVFKPDGTVAQKKVDIHELTLEQEGNPNRVVLVLNKPGTYSELSINMRFLITNSVIPATQGTVFSLQSVQYQVITINKVDGEPPNVVVKRIDSGKEFTLLPYKEEPKAKPPEEPAPAPNH